jgi:hypothetical protein
MKTDKEPQTFITKFPVFVSTFQHGTEVLDVVKIKKSTPLRHSAGKIQEHEAGRSML